MSETPEKLLLVDDDEAFLQVMGRALRRRGFEVLPAMTADEALAAGAAIASQEANFVLVPEVRFPLEGAGGFLEALEQRIGELRELRDRQQKRLEEARTAAAAAPAVRVGAPTARPSAATARWWWPRSMAS